MGNAWERDLQEERMPIAVAKFVEYKLRCYPEHKMAIEAWEEARKDIPHQARQWNPGGGGGGTGDPTSAKAVRMMLLGEKVERESFWVKGIDDVLETLPDEDKDLVRMRYFEGYLTNAGVARALHVSERSFYRRRDEVLAKFARRFGLM